MTQTADVIALLRANPRGITALDALRAAGCFRLAARVADLRAEGHDIRTQMVATAGGKHVALYTLHERPVQLTLLDSTPSAEPADVPPRSGGLRARRAAELVAPAGRTG